MSTWCAPIYFGLAREAFAGRGSASLRRSSSLQLFCKISVELLEHVGPFGFLGLDQRLHGGVEIGQERAVWRDRRGLRLPSAGDARQKILGFAVEGGDGLVAHV